MLIGYFRAALAAAALLALGTSASHAAQQQASPGSEAPTAPCELHIWPTEKISFQGKGVFSSAGWLLVALDQEGHVKGNDRGTKVASTALSGSDQIYQLVQTDPVTLLKTKPAVIVRHMEPLSEEVLSSKSSRHSNSASTCYYELAVKSISIVRKTIYPPLMRVVFVYRVYGDGSSASYQHYDGASHYLHKFPKNDTDDFAAGNEEMQAVYKGIFVRFASGVK